MSVREASDRGIRARMIPVLLLLLALFGLMLVLPDSAEAHHGAYHWDQHTMDWSSSMEAWPHTGCTEGCNQLEAEIWKSGAWWGGTCNSGLGQCYDVYGPHKSYSFPVTVSTRHNAIADPWHSGGTRLDVYYP